MSQSAGSCNFLTRSEVADRLRVCRRTIDRLLASGLLQRCKVRGRTLIPEASLNAYIRSSMGVKP